MPRSDGEPPGAVQAGVVLESALVRGGRVGHGRRDGHEDDDAHVLRGHCVVVHAVYPTCGESGECGALVPFMTRSTSLGSVWGILVGEVLSWRQRRAALLSEARGL